MSVVHKTEPNCLEIASNIALHPTIDIIAYSGTSLAGQSHRGKVFFRSRNFVDLFEGIIDRHFDFAVFDPATNKLVVEFIGADVCILDYDIALSTVSMGSCKKTPGLMYKPYFYSADKILGIHQSTMILIDYPSLTTERIYSVQPSLGEIAYNTDYHYHIYPNLKVLRMNRNTLNYETAPVYQGFVSSAIASPQPGEQDDLYLVENNIEIKRI